MKYAKKGLGVAMLVALFSPVWGLAQTQVAEHWSRNNYPREIPEGVKVHIVVKGDSLWAIAAAHLGDPYLWPQVYSKNDYIADPNLIYPGDPIRLDIGTVVSDQAISQSVDDDDPAPVADTVNGESGDFEDMQAATGDDEADQGKEDLGSVSEVTDFNGDDSEFIILPAGEREEMDCSTIIMPVKTADSKVETVATVVGSENRDLEGYSVGDVVYLNAGLNRGLKAGAEFTVLRQLELIREPNGALLGAAVDQVGHITLVAIQENSAIGVVSPGCYDVRINDNIVPYVQEPIPLITELPKADRFGHIDTSKDVGYVVRTEENLASAAKGNLINVNLGLNKNVAPGDLFVLFRDNPSNNAKRKQIYPEVFLGHAVALKSNQTTSLMKIITSNLEIMVGDKIVPLSQMTGSQ